MADSARVAWSTAGRPPLPTGAITAGERAVISSKPGWKNPLPLDERLYKAWHLIETFFARPEQFGAIATRHNKTARNDLAAVHPVAAAICLD